MLSVIVQSYNGAAFLREALDSVFAQGQAADEVLIVDDGSCDGSVAIARSEPRARLLFGPHTGLAGARNRGLAAARGDLVAFLDGDDRWAPFKLALQRGVLERIPACDAVIGHMRRFAMPDAAFHAPDDPSEFARVVPAPIPSALLVRRAAVERVGGFDPSLTIACDTDWMLRLLDSGARVDTLAEVVLHKRIHARNVSACVATNQRELLAAVRRSVERRRSRCLEH